MKIAIIGSGKVGRALALASTRAGHQVTLSAADPEHARQAAATAGVASAATNLEAAQDAEVVILAVPYAAVEGILAGLGGAVAGKVLIDATNPTRADGSGLLHADTSGAEVIQALAPAARVVKALNTVLASRQQQPQGDGTTLDGFFAGDDADAKTVVGDYLASLGFRPLDVGPLAAAATLEAMAYLNISLQMRNGWSWQMGWKLLGPTV
jgi:NADPH-dependent F420 reductase